ncbi:nitrilase-related carbon-nitrogen hydrolase [Glaciibacter sp. 2TAF33]|uniref:nitrilase-related carbon-nitrogen hydrolase n=1 Tax=Glaciibacter sp. 2TAF33 TaxID=3233015 RepID=UPI003F931207
MSARVAVATFDPVFGDLNANARRATDLIRRARGRGADIVVLPELCLSGYMFDSKDEVDTLAITLDHAVFSALSEALGDRPGIVIAGFAERMPNGTFCISAAIIDMDGIVGVYRKSHLWNREKRFFTPGDDAPPIIATPWGRVGVLICYDLEFPEMSRSIAMRGADLIAVPTNWSRDLSGPAAQPAQVMVARATARLNHVYVACSDRTGLERNQEFASGSALIDTQGRVLARRRKPGIAIAEMDLPEARRRESSPVNHVFADRRPELYA